MSPVLLIVIPLAFAFVALSVKGIAKPLLYLVCLINPVILLMADQGTYAMSGYMAPYGISLRFDAYAFLGLILIHVVFGFTLSVIHDKLAGDEVVYLVLLAGINGMLLTNDLFNLFVMIEVATIAAYILTRRNQDLGGTLHYMILTGLGSASFLLGTVLVYRLTGKLEIAGMNMALMTVSPIARNIAFGLILFGLGIELKLLPLGSWAKSIYGKAHVTTGVIFASIMASAFAFVFGRLMYEVLDDGLVTQALLILAAFTVVAAELVAFNQGKLRSMLAFSSIAHSGLVTMMYISGDAFSATFLVVNLALSKAILYWIACELNEAYGKEDTSTLKGVFYHHKLLGLAFTIGAFSAIGLPLFFGFFAKVSLLSFLFNQGMVWVIVVITGSMIEMAYLMKWLLSLWSSAGEGEWAHAQVPATKAPLLERHKTLAVTFVALLLLTMGLRTINMQDWLYDATQDLGAQPVQHYQEGGAQ